MGLLAGKTALIVGVANERSYAWHITKALFEHGCKCLFTHLPGEKNERRTRRSVDELSIPEPWLRPMDASSDEDLDRVFAEVGDAVPRLDVMVHSIAFADRDVLSPGSFIRTTRAQYLSALDISSYTLLAMARRAAPLMQKPDPARPGAPVSGSILAMSYYGGEKVVPGYNVMGVAKAALECTARYLAWELGPANIRVNVISGGYLRTLASSAVGGADAMEAHNLQRAPLRRNVEGADVGKTAVYLASDLASGVTAETVYVDCGVNSVGA